MGRVKSVSRHTFLVTIEERLEVSNDSSHFVGNSQQTSFLCFDLQKNSVHFLSDFDLLLSSPIDTLSDTFEFLRHDGVGPVLEVWEEHIPETLHGDVGQILERSVEVGS